MNKNTGGPAFPGSYTGNHGMPVWSDGMTLRDYFAAMAMQSYIAATATKYTHNGEQNLNATPDEQIAQFSYEIADVMLAEREKQ